jgi:hypothetical protein
VKYHSLGTRGLTRSREAGPETTAGGQFDWGGRLPKGNGGAQRFSQAGWSSAGACKGARELDCKADTPRRDESRT